jgi:tetratricopeptide (TPR) repeat protein
MLRRFIAAAALLATAAASCSKAPAPPQYPPAAASAAPTIDAGTDPAIGLFERHTAEDPRDHLSATMLAELRLRRAGETLDPEEFRRAEVAAKTALERQPGHPPAIVALARAVAGQGRADEARKLVHDLLDVQPRNVPALNAAFDFALDDLALGTARESAASAYADRLLAVNEEPGTLSRMAQIAELHADFDRAVALFRRAARSAEDLGGLPPEIAEYRRRAGWTLMRAARPDDAAREFAVALDTYPREVDAWRGRAEILAGRDDIAGAIDAMTKAAAIRPTSDVRERLDAFRVRAGAEK